MKKIFSILLALVLVFVLCIMPASAETNSSEWKKGTGPAEIDFSDEGTKIVLEEGLSFYYFKNQVNVRDFTVKLKLNTPNYEGDPDWGYWAMLIGGDGKFSGSSARQNFVLFVPRGEANIRVDSRILSSGIGGAIEPKSKMLTENVKEYDLTIQGKQVDDDTYSLIFNNGAMVYEYSIPENMNFVEDLNGQGCLGFGGCINPNMSEGYEQGSFNIVVKEINGVAMNGKNPPASSNNSNGGATNGNTTEDSDFIVGDSIDTTDTNNATTEESVNTLLISFIICSGVLLLAVVVAVVVIIILKRIKGGYICTPVNP